VIPALIQRIYQAKKKNNKSVRVWGTGRASREFLYVKDAARAIVAATEKYDKLGPVNLSGGNEISVLKLTNLICELIGYHGQIIWDKSKPDGQPKRKVDGSKACKEFGFIPETELKSGLIVTIDWYLRHINKISEN
jgi:GDP-L-fucose synthase